MSAIALMAVTPSVAQAAPAWPVLSSGSSGANVSAAQFLLRHHGQDLAADGAFGSGTTSAVKAFQSAKGLSSDGVIGAGTWGALVVTVNEGANSNAVRALQTLLNKYGHGLGVDGQYGAGTATAVRDFKSDNGLSGGTEVGATTWQWLAGNSGGGGSGGYRLILDRSVLPRGEYDDPHHDYPAIDLPTNTGTRTYAITSGTVSHVGGGCGLGIGISGDDGAYYQYCHLSSRQVSAGSRVSAGNQIGLTGNTGNSTGPHLHLEVRVNGGNRCPQKMLLALYDGVSVPSPQSLPSSGCTY